METIGASPSFPPSEKAVSDIKAGYGYPEEYMGLTKREYFAAMAMQGFASIEVTDMPFKSIAQDSVRMADALITELNKSEE